MIGRRPGGVAWALGQLAVGLVMLALLAASRDSTILWLGLLLLSGILVLLGIFRPLDATSISIVERHGTPLMMAVFGVVFLLVFRNSPYALLLAALACLYAVVAMANNLTTGLLGFVDISAAAVMGIGA